MALGVPGEQACSIRVETNMASLGLQRGWGGWWCGGRQSRHAKEDKRTRFRNFPGRPLAETPRSQGRGPGSTPGQRTRSQVLQPRVHMHAMAKMEDAATKTCHGQINTFFFFKEPDLEEIVPMKSSNQFPSSLPPLIHCKNELVQASS